MNSTEPHPERWKDWAGTHWFVPAAGGALLHVVESGPSTGPLIIFLHGFPEFWYGWRSQIPFFANLGYRVLIPDQRGYNLSEKPGGIAAYSLDLLAADVVALIAAVGREHALVVGHDWGGAVAWWTAIVYPRKVSALAVLNCPHPGVLRQNIRSNSAQRRRSWYMFFLQLPWLPEKLLACNGYKILAQAMQQSARPRTFNADDLARYRESWSQPGTIRAMVNWYRAAFRHQPQQPFLTRVSPRTLILWGRDDRFLGEELINLSLDKCDDGRSEVLNGATHWLHHEEFEQVNRLLHRHFQSHLEKI